MEYASVVGVDRFNMFFLLRGFNVPERIHAHGGRARNLYVPFLFQRFIEKKMDV
jgi:hypothetical protein